MPIYQFNNSSNTLMSYELQFEEMKRIMAGAGLGMWSVENIEGQPHRMHLNAKMAELLGVGTSDPILDLIGTKTVFWKVGFETERSKVSAVFAAVPEKESQKKIEKYILVKKEIISKGGAI